MVIKWTKFAQNKTKTKHSHVSGCYLMLPSLLECFGKLPSAVHEYTVCLHASVCLGTSSSLTIRTPAHSNTLPYCLVYFYTSCSHKGSSGYKSCQLPFLIFHSSWCFLWMLGEVFFSPQQQTKCSFSLLQMLAMLKHFWDAFGSPGWYALHYLQEDLNKSEMYTSSNASNTQHSCLLSCLPGMQGDACCRLPLTVCTEPSLAASLQLIDCCWLSLKQEEGTNLI